MALTLNDIISSFRNRGRGDPPSALADIFVGPLLKVSNYLDSKLDLSRTEQTLNGILALLEDPTTLSTVASSLQTTTDALTTELKSAISTIGSNYGLTRRAATG